MASPAIAGPSDMNDQAPRFVGSTELRRRFLDYFRRNGHTVVASSSLVPGQQGLRPFYQFTVTAQVSQPGQASSRIPLPDLRHHPSRSSSHSS